MLNTHSGYVERLIFNRISASFAFGYLKTKKKIRKNCNIYLCNRNIYPIFVP